MQERSSYNICHAYLQLVTSENQVWEDKGVTYEKLRLAIINFISQIEYQNYKDIPELCDEKMTSLCAVVTSNTTWFNFDLLEYIVAVVGEGKDLLETYKEKELKPYLEQSIFDISSNSFSSFEQRIGLLSTHAPLVFKFIDSKIGPSGPTGNDAMFLKTKIKAFFNIQSIELITFQPGCVELVFAIPQILFDTSPHDSPLHQYTEWNKETKEYRITAPLAKVL